MTKCQRCGLFVEETLDAHLRGLLEGGEHHFHFGKLAVGRQAAVGAGTDLFRDVGDGFFVQAGLLDGILVQVDQGDDLAVAVHHHGFCHEGLVVHDGFHFLRIDVLPVGGENHALGATLDEDVAVLVHNAQVARAQEAVVGEGVRGGLGILEVADGDVLALRLDFTSDVLGIFGVDADGGAVHGLSAGTGHVFGPVLVGEQRTGLGHAVAHQVGELDAPEEFFHLGVQGGAAHDEFLHLAAEGLHQSFLYLLIYDVVEDGDFGEELDAGLVQRGFDLGFVDFLHHQGNGDEQVGLDLGEGLEQRGRGRGLAQPVDGGAVAEGIDEFDDQAVHVGHRQHRDHPLAGGNVALVEIDVCAEVAVGEHYALRVSAGAGGVVDGGEVVPVVGGELDVGGTVAARPFFREQFFHRVVGRGDFLALRVEELPAVDIDDELQRGHLVDVHLGEFVLVGEEGDALRMVDQEGGAFWGEVGQQGHDDGFVGIDGEVGHAPARAVAGPQRNLLTFLQADVFESEMQFLDLSGHLAIGERFSAEAVECGFVPELFGSVLQPFQVMRISVVHNGAKVVVFLLLFL